MRGKKFFEIYTVLKCGGRQLNIWNSWPNNCEGWFWSQIWKTYSPLNILRYHYKKKPRYWMVDEHIPLHRTRRKNFNKMTFKWFADTSITNLTLNPFTPITLHTFTIWEYHANKPIYFLIDPHKRKWILHSIAFPKSSSKKHPTFIESNSNLPYGWSYSIHHSNSSTYINSINGKIKMIYDNLGNRFMYSENLQV